MSSLLVGLTIPSLIKHRVFLNKKFYSDLFPKKFNRKFYQVETFKKYFSSEKGECLKSQSSADTLCCKKKACQTNKDEVAKPKSEIQEKRGPLKSLYNDPECCIEKCPNANIKLDCLFYKMSDKRTRKYQQTWADCPPMRKQEKIFCHNPFIERDPPLPIRAKNSKPPRTACSMEGKDSSLMQCRRNDNKTACIKIRMPGCRGVRDPPTCKSDPNRDCEKIFCPFPAYSECKKPKIKSNKQTECNCLEIKSMCDIYAIAKKKGMAVRN